MSRETSPTQDKTANMQSADKDQGDVSPQGAVGNPMIPEHIEKRMKEEKAAAESMKAHAENNEQRNVQRSYATENLLDGDTRGAQAPATDKKDGVTASQPVPATSATKTTREVIYLMPRHVQYVQHGDRLVLPDLSHSLEAERRLAAGVAPTTPGGIAMALALQKAAMSDSGERDPVKHLVSRTQAMTVSGKPKYPIPPMRSSIQEAHGGRRSESAVTFGSGCYEASCVRTRRSEAKAMVNIRCVGYTDEAKRETASGGVACRASTSTGGDIAAGREQMATPEKSVDDEMMREEEKIREELMKAGWYGHAERPMDEQARAGQTVTMIDGALQILDDWLSDEDEFKTPPMSPFLSDDSDK